MKITDEVSVHATDRQFDVLQHIAMCIHEGLPPTHREIAEYFGWASNKAARDHIVRLRRNGLVEQLPGISRGLRVTGKGYKLLKSRRPDDDSKRAKK